MKSSDAGNNLINRKINNSIHCFWYFISESFSEEAEWQRFVYTYMGIEISSPHCTTHGSNTTTHRRAQDAETTIVSYQSKDEVKMIYFKPWSQPPICFHTGYLRPNFNPNWLWSSVEYMVITESKIIGDLASPMEQAWESTSNFCLNLRHKQDYLTTHIVVG